MTADAMPFAPAPTDSPLGRFALAAAALDAETFGDDGLLDVLGVRSLLPLIDPDKLAAAIQHAAIDDPGNVGEWIATRIVHAYGRSTGDVIDLPAELVGAAFRAFGDSYAADGDPVPASAEVGKLLAATVDPECPTCPPGCPGCPEAG